MVINVALLQYILIIYDSIVVNAAAQNLLKLLGYIFDNPLELVSPIQKGFLKHPEVSAAIIY